MGDSARIKTEIHDGFSLIVPDSLESTELDGLSSLAEKMLIEKKQDVVLSLRNVDTVFSVHLTIFVQLYKLLKSFNLRFIITDISPAVLNVMQMTQLENLLPLYLTLDHFQDSLRAEESISDTDEEKVRFSFHIDESQGEPVVECHGYLEFGEEVRRLQEVLDSKKSFTLDFQDVGYVDTRVLILLSDMAEEHFIKVRGASNVIQELFDEHHLTSKFELVD